MVSFFLFFVFFSVSLPVFEEKPTSKLEQATQINCGYKYSANVSSIITPLTSDVRRETPTNEVKAKYRSIKDAFANFDFSKILEGTYPKRLAPSPSALRYRLCMYDVT